MEALSRDLRAAAGRCRSLGRGDRRTALRLWLAYRLRGRDAGEVRRALRALAAAFAGPPPRTPEARGPTREEEVLLDFGRAYHGAAWDSMPEPERLKLAASALAELVSRVRALGGLEERPLRATVTELEVRASTLDGAVRRAAQESFERLLESLSPRALEASAGKGGLKLGAFRKADLYEAWVEKYGQLEAYHRAGRLVGDFRAVLGRHLKAGAREKEQG